MKLVRKNIGSLISVSVLTLIMLFSFSEIKAQGVPDSTSTEATADTIIGVDTIAIVPVQLDTLAVINPASTINVDSAEAAQQRFETQLDAIIAQRMKGLEKDVNLEYNKKVKGFIDYFTGRNRNYLLMMERRKNLYFPIFEEILRKNNMPEEIKYLSIVESGLNPLAISRVGAAGLWQFMPGTGKEVGLVINDYIDERLDPYKSTEAACKYLSRLYKAFGDWELALASYNCGPGVVKRGIRQSGRHTFWTIYDYLPRETRSYVPQYAAVTYAMNYLEEYNMVADSIEYPMAFDTVTINQFTNIHILCEKLNICYEDFVKLNPAIRTNILPDNINYPVRLPKDKMLEYLLNQHEIMECVNVATDPIQVETADRRKTSSGTIAYRQKLVHTVKRGEVLGKIAVKYGVTVSQIRSWNRIKGNTIRIGQKLVVYRMKYSRTSGQKPAKAQTTVTTPVAKSSNGKPNPRYHYVQPGDTLWTISKKYGGISVDKLKKLNKIKGNTIKVGQKLILS